MSVPSYRYRLHREWMGAGGIVNFIMLNPSTADDTTDDATIRKCIGFAKRWGFRGLVVTNLFAARATDPRELLKMGEGVAIGERNDEWVFGEAAVASALVCAWGDLGHTWGRDEAVHALLDKFDLGCIGFTRGMAPLHPSRCAYTTAPAVYRIAGAS